MNSGSETLKVQGRKPDHVYDDGSASFGSLERHDYAKHYREIQNGRQLRATLRAGQFAWPGGYPLYLVTRSGDGLHFDCVKENFYQAVWDIRNGTDTGWKVELTTTNYECNHLTCAHCNKPIEAAYGEQ
ncbi:hypothetical protein PAHA111176_08185 [Parendozoicomonas haliclonae]|uniref:Uncharacterized protein n=1 Tax=Parendozoicomonas haliclonae TaxID=1960125 RepID=A0A1X7AEQ5_9GAMM|nr:hypothetical protein EHSB41UT_00294 [Parendozoicomonas haliclonae]